MKYEFNNNCLLFNDNAIAVLDKMIEEGNKVDMIFTDPPYRVNGRGCAGKTHGILKDTLNMKGVVFKHNDIEISDWIGKFYEVLKDTGHCYIMTNNKNLSYYLNEIEKTNFHIIKILIWKKDNCITNMYYMDAHEYIIFCRKGKAVKINNCGTKSVLEVSNTKGKVHPTEKPVELTDILVGNSSNKGEVVLDPFMGVGGCGISCKKLGRKFIGIELDENYYNVAKERIQNTKQESE